MHPHWLLPAIFRRIDLARSEGLEPPGPLIRSHPRGHPDPFRSVRDLGRAAARRSRESGELEGRSSAWLPAAHETGHRDALVLVTDIGPSTGERTAPCPAQTPPSNPTAAEPVGRRVLSRVGVADHKVTPKAPWTGSGWREYSYGGFGGGQPHSSGHADCRHPILPTWDYQLGNLCRPAFRMA